MQCLKCKGILGGEHQSVFLHSMSLWWYMHCGQCTFHLVGAEDSEMKEMGHQEKRNCGEMGTLKAGGEEGRVSEYY